ncbi:MAG TPA: AMP-binding protein [Candidatus Limnocylindrales bacterium]|nr:AMP-binding protein [Candidatus Limnocylindrales bacterium]
MDENLYSILRAGFSEVIDRAAFVSPGEPSVSWRELDDLVAGFASVLMSRGVEPGDRVVAQVEKSLGAVALYLATIRIGAVFVPLNTAYTDAEVASFLADAEPRVFVASTKRESPSGVMPELLGTTITSPLWSEALSVKPARAVAPRTKDDLAAIVYTSGTTGRSKGAMLSHGNLASNAATLVKLWEMTASDVLLHALPIYHVHGLFVALHTAMLAGATTLFLAKFDAEVVRRALAGATMMMGVPTFYTRLLALDGFGRDDCGGMRLFISGSAPLLADTHREFEERTGHRILERYGMTETGMLTSNPLRGERIAGTVGFALPDVRIRVADATGAPVPAGDAGVLEVAGPNVFAGYWRRPERSPEDFRPDGYFITGDIGVAAAGGRITLVGRAKDLIITGGLNVYPKEVEEVLDAVDGVVESAVIGVPDADFGEAIVAVVVREDGDAVTAESLETAARTSLARFKHPRRIEFVDALPRNAIGKVQKNVLRERYAGRAR